MASSPHHSSWVMALLLLGFALLHSGGAALRPWGDPLRWAITQVDEATGLATVEAVVTTASMSQPSFPPGDTLPKW